MKNKFNFLQVANWIYLCILNIDEIKKQSKNLSKEEIKQKLLEERRKITIIKEVLEKKRRLFGINREFMIKLEDIKKQYGIEE